MRSEIRGYDTDDRCDQRGLFRRERNVKPIAQLVEDKRGDNSRDAASGNLRCRD